MPDAPDSKRMAKRRDAEGNLEFGPNWDTLIERQIREAMETGKFRELPHHGQPLPDDENPYAGEMALGFHMLKNAGVAPPWVEADKEVRELLAQLELIVKRASSGPTPSMFARKRDRQTLIALVAQANAAIVKVNAEAPTQRQHRRALVLDDVLAEYEAACRR